MIRRFFGDGLHWVVIAGLLMGYCLYSAAHADANPAGIADRVVRYAITNETAICATLDEIPTPAGVDGLVLGIIGDGLDPAEAGQALAIAVIHGCPRHEPLLMAWTGQRTTVGRMTA